MPNGYNNWNFKQVVKILKDNNFVEIRTKGSHFQYYNEDIEAMVTIPFHGARSINTKTLKSITIQSKLSKKMWGIVPKR